MQYYIKNPANKEVEGPYSLDDINAKVASGAIAPDQPWLATFDFGGGLGRARVAPPRAWIPLSSLSGISPGLLPPEAYPPVKPDMTAPTVGLVIGLLALGMSLYWMYGSGIKVQTKSEIKYKTGYHQYGSPVESYSYSESINPLPSVTATSASFLWTASFGWLLARRLKAGKEIG